MDSVMGLKIICYYKAYRFIFNSIRQNLRKMVLFYWFLIGLMVRKTMQKTPANKTIQNLQAGSFVFHGIQQKETHLYMLQFAVAFQNTPQMAFAINSLQSNQHNSNVGFDLSPQAIALTGAIIIWKRSLHKWITVQISYFASTRNDLYLGHQLVKISNGASTLHDIKFSTSNNLTNAIARLFLTGCSSSTLLFDCGVVAKEIKVSNLTVAVYTTSGSGMQVSFSYIMFIPPTTGFSCFGGMFQVDSFIGSRTQNIQKLIYRTKHVLYGFSTLTFNADQPQNIRSNIDLTMLLTFQATNAAKFRLIYVALGKSSKQSCSQPSLPYEWEDACVESCPNTTSQIQYPNGGKACMSCLEKLNMTLNNGSCVCKEGYQMNKVVNKCLLRLEQAKSVESVAQEKMVGSDSHPSESLTDMYERLKIQLSEKLQSQRQSPSTELNSSGQNASLVQSNKTVQKNKEQEKLISQKEENKTAVNAISLNNKILQNSNQGRKIQNSQQNQQPNVSQSRKTENPTPQSTQVQYISDSSQTIMAVQNNQSKEQNSMALPTFVNLDSANNGYGLCTDQNSFLLQGACICKPGYQKINNQCQSISSTLTSLPIYIDEIPTKHTCDLNQDRSCPCHSDPHPPPVCLPPSFLGSRGQCQCPPHSIMFEGCCIQCPFPAVFDYRQGKCILYCQQNQIFDNSTQRCICRPGYGFGRKGKCTYCSSGSFLINGYCAACLDGKIYSEESNSCVCPSGTFLDSKGDCIGRCGQLEHFDQEKGSCVCDQGFGRVRGRCAICPQNEVVDQNGECQPCLPNQQIIAGQCKCKRNFVLRNQRCVACEKINGGIQVEGICTRCPQGYQLENGECRCRKDFTVENNQCLPCTQVKDAFIVNGTCTKCETGQLYVDGVCIKISPAPPTYPLPERAIKLSTPPECGNGLIEGLEECDDRNRIDGDGCSSRCQAEAQYICQRMPSRCQRKPQRGTTTIQTLNLPNPKPTVSTNSEQNSKQIRSSSTSSTQTQTNETKTSVSDKQSKSIANIQEGQNSEKQSLTLEGKVNGNSNQVFITLNTQTAFDFPDQSAVQNFFKTTFSNIRPPTIYFNQHLPPHKNIFDCLLIFPSGVPNSAFTVSFSYSKDGKSGSLQVVVDPMLMSAPTRSRIQSRRDRK